jgi:hypothetical protein
MDKGRKNLDWLNTYGINLIIRIREDNMNTKLTLKMDSRVISRAKGYAAKEGKSLSQMVENYFKLITGQKEKEGDITPLVQELSGVIRLEKGRDIKGDYTDYLGEKYK